MSDTGYLKQSHPQGATTAEVSFPTKYSDWTQVVSRVAELEADKARKAEAISDLVDRAEQAEAKCEEMETMLRRKHVRWNLLMAERALAEMSDGRDDD